MSDDQFAKLFTYMEKRFNDVDTRFEKAGRDIADIRGSIAELSANVNDMCQEFMILSHQFDELRSEVRRS